VSRWLHINVQIGFCTTAQSGFVNAEQDNSIGERSQSKGIFDGKGLVCPAGNVSQNDAVY
jgi:hypothetical protein